jgi:hypothetical protein
MSGAAQSSLVNTLKTLGLISNDGIPTEALAHIVKLQGVERQKILNGIITTSYPFLFDGRIDVKNATVRLLEEQFNEAGASGDTQKKCISFFLAIAKEAGVPLSTYLSKYSKGGKGSGGGARPRRIVPPPGRNNRQDTPPHGDPVYEGPPKTWAQMLLSKFPELDPAWPDDVKAKWFDSFKELMSMRRAEEEEQ